MEWDLAEPKGEKGEVVGVDMKIDIQGLSTFPFFWRQEGGTRVSQLFFLPEKWVFNCWVFFHHQLKFHKLELEKSIFLKKRSSWKLAVAAAVKLALERQSGKKMRAAPGILFGSPISFSSFFALFPFSSPFPSPPHI